MNRLSKLPSHSASGWVIDYVDDVKAILNEAGVETSIITQDTTTGGVFYVSIPVGDDETLSKVDAAGFIIDWQRTDGTMLNLRVFIRRDSNSPHKRTD